MSAADMLRKAADRLEGLAKGATPGPWWVHRDEAEAVWYGDEAETYRLDQAPLATEAELSAWEKSTGSLLHGDVRRTEDAAYIAAMSPEVGLALAAWLRDAAHDEEQFARQGALGYQGETQGLAVARAILGGDA